MLEYYDSGAAYFDEVKLIAGERPSAEELTLFEALARLHHATSGEARILELGCGRCESAPALLRMIPGARFSALDASREAIMHARERHTELDLQVGDISQLPFPDETFDVVYFNYVLEHTCEPDRVLTEALRVARPGGLIGMIVPVSDLIWMMPPSLRHHQGDVRYLLRYAASRWLHLLQLRYREDYFSFPLVPDPIVLASPGTPFTPDDDQIYLGSTLEIRKFLEQRGSHVVFEAGRDVSSFVRNGRRHSVDLARTLLFAATRATLGLFDAQHYTTTRTLVVRKDG